MEHYVPKGIEYIMQIKILTYNIQAGIGTTSFGQYLSKIHHQLFDSVAKTHTLNRIAKFISEYDVVCLQEVDLGGRRSGYSNQVDRIAAKSGHSHISMQENRVVGKISRHGNAVLSHIAQDEFSDIKLPGSKPGRGAVISRITASSHPLYIVNVHLSLGQADQMKQVQHIAQCVPDGARVIVCGDFNCTSTSKPVLFLEQALNVKCRTQPGDKSYPSWKPRRDFDHILSSVSLVSEAAIVQPVLYSDHRPVSLTVTL